MKAIVDAFKGIGSSSADANKIWAEGVHIIGEKYVVTQAEDKHIYARKVRSLRILCHIISRCCRDTELRLY
jgi:hypothetical protein